MDWFLANNYYHRRTILYAACIPVSLYVLNLLAELLQSLQTWKLFLCNCLQTSVYTIKEHVFQNCIDTCVICLGKKSALFWLCCALVSNRDEFVVERKFLKVGVSTGLRLVLISVRNHKSEKQTYKIRKKVMQRQNLSALLVRGCSCAYYQYVRRNYIVESD